MTIMYKEEHGDFYVYLEEHPSDCCCMWRKSDVMNGVYSIERLDVLPELRGQGMGRNLLNAAIQHIESEYPKACIEISAKPDGDSDITKEDLAAFYKSANFEIYWENSSRIDLRLYLDESLKPTPLYDSPEYFKVTL
ncbi:GNAT family N-acetyltransferase [Vibrio sp. ED002]|uniref:GNAT family N-acetyltransferase n=1 Tax=Vibrio sp. ED002 TaxID=2785123 RepID=UPI00200C0285|nr:GNAT family N-acetyltransferase [Vibrio sp. ED002]UQA54489.1 GNAT family N-acetyltransferase [Vibrio sp. ED002]